MAEPTSTWAQLTDSLRSVEPNLLLAEHARVAAQMHRLIETNALPPPVQAVRMAVLRTFTAEPLANSIVAGLAQQELAAELGLGQLGGYASEILSDDSFVYAGKFDAVLLFALCEQIVPSVADASADVGAEAFDEFFSLVTRLCSRFAGQVLCANFAPGSRAAAPVLAAHRATSGRYAIEAANRRLVELAGQHANLCILDVAGLAGEMGGANFFSARDYASSLMPFTPAAMAAIGGAAARLCRLYRGTPIKCIVLDCDNTLWGGVVGEDGVDGVKLGESYPGVCYQQFQRQLAALSRMGFVLALNTRNNPADVEAMFGHPCMALQAANFAAMRINWSDKLTNLRELAVELNIGLDAMLFIDDSPFELELISRNEPQVRCMQTPSQPWKLARFLADCPLLDRVRVGAEDVRKTAMYASERSRRKLRESSGTLEDYLGGLDIRLRVERFDASAHLSRAAQLTQKTNQFNLTGLRMTESEVQSSAAAGNRLWIASASDRFGDYGRIALAMVSLEDGEQNARLDVYLVSCRALGRGVEDAFLACVVNELSDAGVQRLRARFVPGPRNAVCRDFLSRRGFVRRPRADSAGGPEEDYELDLAGASAARVAPVWVALTRGRA